MRLQKALREMFVIGIAVAAALFLLNGPGGHNLMGVVTALIVGWLLSVPVWLLYRLVRFMVTPRAY